MPKKNIIKKTQSWKELISSNSIAAKYRKLIINIKKYFNINEKNISNLHNSAINAYINRNYDDAIQYLEEIIIIDNKKIDALNNLGLCYFSKENFDQAVEKYKQALVIDVKNVFTLNCLGFCYYKQKKYLEAIEWFKQAIAIDKDNTGTLNGLGACYLEKQKYDKATKKFLQSLNSNPEDIEALSNLGACYAEQKKFDQAINYFIKIKKITKNKENTNKYIDKCLKKIRKFDKKYIEEEKFEDIKDLKNKIKEIRRNNPNKTILFRGHEDKDWELKPGIHRKKNYNLSIFKENFSRNSAKYLGKHIKNEKNNTEIQAEMQHYGIPTKLLDWTESPLIALYFALCEGEDFTKTPITDVCVWVAVCEKLDTRIPEVEKEKNKIKFIAPTLKNDRIAAQKGFFSYTQSNKCLTEIAKDNKEIKLYRFLLKNDFLGNKNIEHKEDVENEGITPLSIYPDHVGLKQEIISYSKKITGCLKEPEMQK